MANINIAVEALSCEAPIFTNVQYTLTQWNFLLSWTSLGDLYKLADPNAKLALVMKIYVDGNITPYEYQLGDVNFNETDYLVEMIPYYDSFSPKYKLEFELVQTNNYCVKTTVHTIPGNTLPN